MKMPRDRDREVKQEKNSREFSRNETLAGYCFIDDTSVFTKLLRKTLLCNRLLFSAPSTIRPSVMQDVEWVDASMSIRSSQGPHQSAALFNVRLNLADCKTSGCVQCIHTSNPHPSLHKVKQENRSYTDSFNLLSSLVKRNQILYKYQELIESST